jgi:hypothetical protein
MASWAIVDQLMLLLPKDNEQAAGQIKQLYALLDAATIPDPALAQEPGRRGQEADHRRRLRSPSQRKDSASSSSSSGRRRGQSCDEGDLCDVIRTKDMHVRIESRRQDRDRVEQERRNERDYDMYDPYYDQPTGHRSPARTRNSGGIKPFSRDLRKVIWPPNFKPSAIDKYDGSTNPVEWLEVYHLAIVVAGGTHTSWSIIYRFAYHPLPEPG